MSCVTAVSCLASSPARGVGMDQGSRNRERRRRYAWIGSGDRAKRYGLFGTPLREDFFPPSDARFRLGTGRGLSFRFILFGAGLLDAGLVIGLLAPMPERRVVEKRNARARVR